MNWAKWDAEHGSGGTSVSSADKIAAQIRGALGAPKTDESKVKSTKGRSGSVISRAESARSTAAHVQKKDMKRPAPVKGEKDAADSFRTKIRMAAYNEKKKAAAASDPINKMTPHTEVSLNPHESKPKIVSMGTDPQKYKELRAGAMKASGEAQLKDTASSHTKAAAAHTAAAKAATNIGARQFHEALAKNHSDAAAKASGDFAKAHDQALKASATAKDLNTYSSHMVAAAHHAAAAKLAANTSDKEIHEYGVTHHQAMADKIKAGKTADRIASMIKGIHNEQHGLGKPKVSQEADKASEKANAGSSLSAHQAAIVAHTKAEAAAHLNGDTALVKHHRSAIRQHRTAANKLEDEMYAKIEAAHADSTATPPAPKHTVPALAEQRHPAGSAEDLASKAEAATREANAHPSYVNHQKAYEAHTAALSKATTSAYDKNYKAREYHTMMQGYHRFAADHPGKVIPAGIQQEHTDELADRLPEASPHQLHTAFTDTNSRRHSQQMYDAVTNAADTKLTAAQKASIGAYTGSGYTTINTYHRKVVNGNKHMSADSQAYAQKHTANLDAAFAKQPALQHDLVTYRGTREADTLFGKVGERVGGEFIDHGYTSTASHAASAGGFGGATAGASAANSTLVRVLHPAGSKVLKPSSVGSFNDAEREILAPRGTRYHIAADRIVTLQNGRTQRQVDLIRK